MSGETDTVTGIIVSCRSKLVHLSFIKPEFPLRKEGDPLRKLYVRSQLQGPSIVHFSYAAQNKICCNSLTAVLNRLRRSNGKGPNLRVSDPIDRGNVFPTGGGKNPNHRN